MGELRDSLLKQQIQREIDEAKTLQTKGKRKEASDHYILAANLYRRLAFVSDREHSESYFLNASQYETLGVAMRRTEPSALGEPAKVIDSMIISQKPTTKWDDIGGLDEVKTTIREAVVIPFIHKKPEFVEAPKIILLYGPPGTGKTLLAKAACNSMKATFFEASTANLLSKYFGESSKIISALFKKAREKQPSIIFMDEFDSLMLSRDSGIQEPSRRVVGQLLQEIEGFSSAKGSVLIIAATNKPWDLDDAMISRFQRKIYVPLPDSESRKQIFGIHLKGVDLDGITIDELASLARGCSGRDIANICREAVMEMIREQNPGMKELTASQVEKYEMRYRSLVRNDFEQAMKKVRPSSDHPIIRKYEEWGEKWGM